MSLAGTKLQECVRKVWSFVEESKLTYLPPPRRSVSQLLLRQNSKSCPYEELKSSYYSLSCPGRSGLTGVYFHFSHQFIPVLWMAPHKEQQLLQHPSHAAAMKESQLAAQVLFSYHSWISNSVWTPHYFPKRKIAFRAFCYKTLCTLSNNLIHPIMQNCSQKVRKS